MEKEIEKEYFELLRLESVGADPSKWPQSAACASWLSRWLGDIGFATEIIAPEDGSAPGIVFAERAGAEGAARVLIYGHYDVQPADPVDEWETPPFEPTVKDGRVYCRGAQDDKGQSYAFLCGLRE
jgi:acetylornithine deacetylase/succinyl-diaminopimelate desuccinylase-like protein